MGTQSQIDRICGQHLAPKKLVLQLKKRAVLKTIYQGILLRIINIKRKNLWTSLFEYKVKSNLTLIRKHLI